MLSKHLVRKLLEPKGFITGRTTVQQQSWRNGRNISSRIIFSERPAKSTFRQKLLLASIASATLTAISIGCLSTGIPAQFKHGNGLLELPILDKRRLPNVNYATVKEMDSAVDEIRSQLKDVDRIISTDPADLKSHGYSEWSSVNADVLPVAVAYPRCTEHVQTIARICHARRIPIVPYSGGSSVEGHTSAPFGGISIDFGFMDKCLRFSPDDMDATVQPGLCWADLNEELASQGSNLFFPIDPAPSAKFGGMVGTNCSGTNAVRYGTMKDWVLNITMVLADGTIIKTRRRPRKCSAGYNLNSLIVGSEGSLGIVTEVTVKLAPVPEQFSVAVVPFPSLQHAVSAAAAVIRRGVPVAALELMDEIQMRVINDAGATLPKVWKEAPTLFFKFSGTLGTVKDNIATVQDTIKAYGPEAFEWATDPEEQAVLWSARKESLYSLLSLRKEGEQLWNTDVAVPLSRLAEIIQVSKAEAEAFGLLATVKGHVGDSNFHENIFYDGRNPEKRENAEKLVKNMVQRALEMEGTCTGEHGIGFGKKGSLAKEVGDDTITLMKLLKSVLDPHWIMNPGKVFDL